MNGGVDSDAGAAADGDAGADAGRSDSDVDTDVDVVVVGGGPAGSSAGVFTSRYGLETVVFDRGNSSIRRCAYLENYLGFPGGIDVETFYELMHDHLEAAGAHLVSSLVESVVRVGDGALRVESDDGHAVTARFVVAATKYDADYLRGLGDELRFEPVEADESESATAAFDDACVDADGRTPAAGLYVAGPLAGGGDQTVIAAGHGAQVARTLIADSRREQGYWDGVATHYDWVRRASELGDEWRERARWAEYFDEQRTPEDVDIEADERERIRDACIDDRLSAYVTSDDVDARTARGHRRLADRLDAEAVVDAHDAASLLDAIDDAVIRTYLDDETTVRRA